MAAWMSCGVWRTDRGKRQSQISTMLHTMLPPRTEQRTTEWCAVTLCWVYSDSYLLDYCMLCGQCPVGLPA